MNELISVIIPTFKRPKLLIRAVNSVLNQSYKNFELLIINDDHLEIDIINNINDKRIQIYKNNRSKGANGARNTGILNSKGDFIAFLDDDDEWLKNKLESQLMTIKSKDISFGGVYSGYSIEKNGNWKNYYGNKDGKILKEVILDKVKICTGSNLLIRSKVIKEVGLWDEDLVRQQDLEFLIRFLNKYKIAFDNSLVTKIYGHNTPNPLKAFLAREKYLVKIKKYIDLLEVKDQESFYSAHYRRQVIYLIKLKKMEEARKFWRKARKVKKISILKDLKILIYYSLGLIVK